MKRKYTFPGFLIPFFILLCADLSAKTKNRHSYSSNATARSATNVAGTRSAPLTFIENVGQVTDQFGNGRRDIHFQLKAGNGLNIYIAGGALHYQFCRMNRATCANVQPQEPRKFTPEVAASDTFSMYRMDVEMIGANKSSQIITEQKQNYYENHFTTATGNGGATALSYNRITYKDIYPNIDWVLYTTNGTLKHEFVVHSGGHIDDIKLRYSGTRDLKVDEEGNLIAVTPQGSITEHAPISFQKNGQKVRSRFVLDGAILSFETGEYTGDLIIDPALFWATYYGGSLQELPNKAAIDGSGNVYICGSTQSLSAIATTGAHQTSWAGGAYDAYVAKFSNSGAILWATYYGGIDQDYGNGVATDATGNVYLTGFTYSASGIATSGAFDTSLGVIDAFLVKFNAAGFRQWGTYFGGSATEECYSVATDPWGDVYISGRTSSATGIATTGAHQTLFAGGSVYYCDAFLAKFSGTGSRLWATYYGGSDDDYGYDVVADASGIVYLTGFTISTSGIATPGAHQSTFGGGPDDAYLAKFNSSGTRLWATYYGGIFNDQGHTVALDGSGNVYIGGHTASPSGIATAGAHQTTFSAASVYDGFFVKFNSAGVRQWGTYYGGGAIEYLYGIALDGSGNAFVTGYTESYTGISTPGTHQPAHGGGLWDGFLAKFNAAGVRQWGSYFGGGDYDYASDVCAGPGTDVFITGYTESGWSIATPGSYQPTYGGSTDAFLAKFDGSFVPPVMGPITGIAAICVGGTTTLSHAITGGTWMSSATGIAAVGYFSGTVTGIAPGTATIAYNTSSGVATIVVTVSAVPGPITAPAFVVCVGSIITLANSTPGGSWSSSAPGVATVGAGSGIVTGVSAATAIITYNNSGCYVTKDVTVSALPNPAISGSYTVCAGNSMPLSSATAGGTWSSSNPGIGSVDAATGVLYGISPGTTTIKYKVSNTCGTDSSTQVITVVAASLCSTGIRPANVETMSLLVSPNPSHGTLTVEMKSLIDEKLSFSVTNTVGKTIIEFTGNTNSAIEINLNQPPGIYFIKTVSGNSCYAAKIIVQ